MKKRNSFESSKEEKKEKKLEEFFIPFIIKFPSLRTSLLLHEVFRLSLYCIPFAGDAAVVSVI